MDAKSRWWKNDNIQITLGNDQITLENTTNFLKELQKQSEFLTWLCFPLLNYLAAFNHIQVSYPAVSEFLAVIFTGTKARTALTNLGGERQRSMRIHVTHWLVWSCCVACLPCSQHLPEVLRIFIFCTFHSKQRQTKNKTYKQKPNALQLHK